MRYVFVECGEDWADGPSDGDFMIVSPASGLDYVVVGGDVLGTFEDESDLCEAIRDQMDLDQFWPNVWHQDERGMVDLVRLVD